MPLACRQKSYRPGSIAGSCMVANLVQGRQCHWRRSTCRHLTLCALADMSMRTSCNGPALQGMSMPCTSLSCSWILKVIIAAKESKPGTIPVVPRSGSWCLIRLCPAARANERRLHLLVSHRGPLAVWGGALHKNATWRCAAVRSGQGAGDCLLRAGKCLL